MRFEVLGPTRVLDGERPVELGPRRRRLLLAALLVDVGRVVPVDLLIDRVWDGRPSASAGSTLHSYVSRLRSSLSAAAHSSPARLTTGTRGYALDVSPEDVDARRFELALADARRLHADGEHRLAYDAVSAALGEWHGAAYVDFDAEFAVAEAARLDDLRLSARELAGELDLALGRHQEAATALQALVVEQPLRESARALLMLALHRSGRQAEALQTYADGRRLLADELGADPGAELQRLHTRILRQDPALDEFASVDRPLTVDVAFDVAAATSAERMIGRAEELGAVTAALARSRQRGAQFVVVVGEAGIGKSRLVEEATIAARHAGDRVAWGRCWQHEGAPAMWPWTQLLRELAAQTEPDEVRRALAGRGSRVAALLPELLPDPAADPSTASAPASFAQAELQTFDAVLAFLTALAERRPAVLVLDDAQWADEISRRMLDYAVRHLRGSAVALLVTVRSPAEDETRSDLDVLATLARAEGAVRIDLPPLSAADVRAFVADRSGSELDERTAAALQARTAGNPFYVGEIVRLVASTGSVSSLAQGVPDSVRGVIRRRLQQLSEPEQRVLQSAAVVGRTFDLELIAAVTRKDPDVVDDAVDNATALGLVRSEPSAPLQHRFTHALLQETLLDETGPALRRRLHRRTAETLLGRRADHGPRAEPAERVAHHFAAAGSADDRMRAAELYLLAADEALARWSYTEAEPLLRAAERTAAELLTDAGRRLHRDARSRLDSLALLLDGGYSTGGRQDGLDGEVSVLDETAPVPEVLTVLHVEWTSAHSRNLLAAAEAVTSRLQAEAERRDDDLLRVAALTAEGYDQLQRGRFPAVAAALGALEPLLPGVHLPSVLTPSPAVAGPLWRGMAETVMGRLDAGERLVGTARERAAELGDPVTQLYLDGVDLFRWVWRDDPEQAWSAAGTTGRAAASGRPAMMRTYTAMPTAWALAHRDPAAGLAMADEAAVVLDEPDGLVLRPFMRGLHAAVLQLAGRHAHALQRVDAALAESSRTGAALYDAELHRIRAVCLHALGATPADVRSALEHGRRIAVAQGAVLFQAHLDATDLALR